LKSLPGFRSRITSCCTSRASAYAFFWSGVGSTSRVLEMSEEYSEYLKPRLSR